MTLLARLASSTPVRRYASHPRRRVPPGPTLSLNHFLQRGRTLALWREIVRAVNRIPESSTREEMRRFAREEFERHRDVTDITKIRYLVSTGKTQFQSMERYIDELAA
ncbi:MAG: hypothetical protein M1817_000108 [Caeruleum heppii]|nr:MAG: hypothetical protein M1817_000108 [Caeruleum heppii]